MGKERRIVWGSSFMLWPGSKGYFIMHGSWFHLFTYTSIHLSIYKAWLKSLTFKLGFWFKEISYFTTCPSANNIKSSKHKRPNVQLKESFSFSWTLGRKAENSWLISGVKFVLHIFSQFSKKCEIDFWPNIYLKMDSTLFPF